MALLFGKEDKSFGININSLYINAITNLYINNRHSMGTSNKELAHYALLIKKSAYRRIQDANRENFIEDVIQEVFLKLHKQQFFENNTFDSVDSKKQIYSYINLTVNTCYMDQLGLLGINRKLTKAEKLSSGNKYENIQNSVIEDVCESEITLAPVQTPEQVTFVTEAYHWIKQCYNSLVSNVNDANRKTFFEAAFWQLSYYNMPVKALAGHLGYSSSNPTQELKRFVEKVSMCTKPHGVTLNNANEQIEFLREQIENTEGGS